MSAWQADDELIASLASLLYPVLFLPGEVMIGGSATDSVDAEGKAIPQAPAHARESPPPSQSGPARVCFASARPPAPEQAPTGKGVRLRR